MPPFQEIYSHNSGVAANQPYTLNQRLNGMIPTVEESVGVDIVRHAESINLAVAGFSFIQLFNAFYRFGNRYRWRWNGSAGRAGDHASLLDDTIILGECRFFVNNFRTLLRSPYPYGLGLNTHPVIERYTGANNEGFVCNHIGAFYKLEANVLPGPSYHGPELYLWDNHKVLNYQNRFWDVCYNQQYENLADMADYQITRRIAYLENATEAICQINGRIAYQANSLARKSYFRRLSTAEIASHPGKSYQGPYTPSELELFTGFIQVI